MEQCIQYVFKRYEKKYLLDNHQLYLLEESFKNNMTEELFGIQKVCNIYFDDDRYSIIRASIEETNYKEKFRLRSYGTPNKEDTVFAEIKRKSDGIVYKRRIPLSLDEAQEYFLYGKRPSTGGQILKEIDYFLHQYHPVPKVFIVYDRRAYTGFEDPQFRVTFDQNIRWRQSQLDLAKGDWGYPLLNNGKTLMEIKTTGTIPLWLSRLLSQLEIFPVSFSKYGFCFKEHILKNSFTIGGVSCA